MWQEPINLAKKTRDYLKRLGFRCLDKNYLRGKRFDSDITNITLEVGNGFKAWDILNQNKLEPEFATLNHLIFIIGIGNSKKDVLSLLKALKKIPPEKQLRKIKYPAITPKIVLSPREASLRKTKKITIKKAVGKISAETLTPYPPGIPLLVPGEIITQEIIDYLKEINKYSSIRMQISGSFKTIKVVK